MSDIRGENWEIEQKRVNMVVEEINKKMKKLDKNVGNVKSDVLDLRKNFWEDVTVNLDEPDDVIETAASLKQQAELLSERERTHGQISRELKTLNKLKNSPYFGRIDVLEKGEKEAERIYLGISSLMDEREERFLIYDWRAPISSLYYDYPPGAIQYQIPEGMIEGEMELKRQFLIKRSKITGMFDTGVTIGDEMLQEVLGSNASTQMKSIVATIQREQNQIIRNEKSKFLFVQGVAGSGKTSAALQRIAYLLYRYRNTIKSENIMLFSPNPLFNSYVATVLPELGEENMIQSTFQEYLNTRLAKEYTVEDAFDQMEFLLTSENHPNYMTRVEGIRLKASLSFKNLIDQFVSNLSNEGIIFKDLYFRKEIIFSKEEIYDYFYSLDKNFSIPNRIQYVKEWLLKELKKKVKVERTKEWVEEEVQLLEKEDYMEAFKQLQEKNRYTENSFDDFEQEQRLLATMVVKEKMKPLFSQVKRLKFIDLVANYQKFFESIVVNHSNWGNISSHTIQTLNKKKIYYEDATPLVYLQDLIEGKKSNTAIRHIFIDEAQDYTPFQFAFLQVLFPYSKITLLGDFNQAIFSDETGAESILSDFSIRGDKVETFFLNKTYRSTKPIVEFTKSLIIDGEKIEPFNRDGRKPTLMNVEESKQLNTKVIKKIHELQNKGYQSVAVITRTANESKEAFTALQREISVHLIEKGTISYEKGVLILPAYLAKGIEFDAVIIYDCSQYQLEKERKLFYTACTRAMHELSIFATNGISPLIGETAKGTYEIENG